MSYSGFSENYNNPFSNVGKSIASAETSASGMMAKFRNNKMVSGSSEFLNSNSLVAKVSFFILVVVLFIIGLRFGSRLLTWVMSPSKNPILINGLRDGQKYKVVPQNPAKIGAKPILRSVNQREGLEFTWSVWLYIKDATWDIPKDGIQLTRKKHIFNKGSSDNVTGKSEFGETNLDGMSFPNNGPGLYIHESKNSLIIVMNTFENVIEEVEIPDIPLNKWFNVSIRCRGRNMDTYINGVVKHRHVFTSVPKQNYGDVYVTRNNGFSGNLSQLRYFDKALTGIEITDLVEKGPNMTVDESLKIFPPYFSLNWFFKRA
jgi:hypothetical protein